MMLVVIALVALVLLALLLPLVRVLLSLVLVVLGLAFGAFLINDAVHGFPLLTGLAVRLIPLAAAIYNHIISLLPRS